MYSGSDIAGRWTGFVTRFAPWIVLAFLLGAATALNYTVRNLGIHTDTADMLSAELPFRQTYERYKQTFPQYVDTLLLVVEGHTPEQARRTAKALGARLEAETELFETVYLPGAEPFFETHGLLYPSTAELEELADNLARIQPFLSRLTEDHSLRGLFAMLEGALEAVREGEFIDLAPVLRQIDRAVEAGLNGDYHRLSWQRLMLEDEADTGFARQFILVQPRLDYGRLLPGGPAIAAVRELARELDLTGKPGVDLRITGGVALAHEELQSVTRGAGLAGLAALVMVLLVLSLGLRSPRLVLASLLSLLLGLILTAAFATAAIGHLNLISVAFAVLYIGLGIDFLIHLNLRYRAGRHTGDAPRTALRETVRDIGPSLLLCAVTTAIGFYAFIPTAYAGVSELGLIAGTGMFISLVISLTFLPALLHLLPPTAARRSPAMRLPDALVEFPLRRGKAIRRGAAVLALGALLLLPRAEFDYNPLNLREPDSESVATFRDLLAESDTPPWHLTLLANGTEQARDYAERLAPLAVVERVVTLLDFIPEDQDDKLFLIEDLSFILGPPLGRTDRKPPASPDEQDTAIRTLLATLDDYLAADDALPGREAAAGLQDRLWQLTEVLQNRNHEVLERLEQSLLATLPDSLALLRRSLQAGPVGRDDLPAALLERWVTPEGIYRVAVYPAENLADNVALRRFVTTVREVAPEATDTPVLMLEAGDAVVSAFRQAFLIALVAIALLLMLLLRSVIDAVLVLSPLLLAGLLTGAVVTLLGIPFNFANIIALPLLLGIGVDNGIHMIRRLRDPTISRFGLLRTSTVRAIIYSALTTIVSFGNLSFLPHQGTASLGQILTVGVLLTLLATILVLPALWALGQQRFARQPGASP